MGQVVTDIAYMIVGIWFMGMVVIVGIVGAIKLYKDIKGIKED